MDYYLSDMNFIVPKGMRIQIGAKGIMKDEKFYKNPLHFDPESHFEDDSGNLYPFSYYTYHGVCKSHPYAASWTLAKDHV